MPRISAVQRRNAWRRSIRQVGVLFVAFGLGNFAFTIFKGTFDLLQSLFLAIFLNVAGLLAINYSIETEEQEVGEQESEERRLHENEVVTETLELFDKSPSTESKSQNAVFANLSAKSANVLVSLQPLFRRIRGRKS